MKYKVVITKQAGFDLRNIYEYIAFTLLEPEIALKQFERIKKGIVSLDEMPEQYKLFEKEPWQSRGIRQMPVDNYLVFYIVNSIDLTVTIIRVIYERRKSVEQLKELYK